MGLTEWIAPHDDTAIDEHGNNPKRLRAEPMKPSAWIALAGFIALVLGYLGTVEYRLGSYEATLDVSERVANLENLLTPLLIEYRVAERMRELAEAAPTPPTPPAPRGTGGTGFSVEFDDMRVEPVDEVREEAKEWASQAVQRAKR